MKKRLGNWRHMLLTSLTLGMTLLAVGARWKP